MTFNLGLAAHAMLNPVVFTDAYDLGHMANALFDAARSVRKMGKHGMADRWEARAHYLISLA